MIAKAKALCATGNSEWRTPKHLFDQLDREFHFTLDPCATHRNARCKRHFTIREDGLAQDWGKHRVFMNPPYGLALRKWMAKAFDAAQKGATVVCLVPSRTDSYWWHKYAMLGDIRFIQGRIEFKKDVQAPFPSAIVIFRRDKMRNPQPMQKPASKNRL